MRITEVKENEVTVEIHESECQLLAEACEAMVVDAEHGDLFEAYGNMFRMAGLAANGAECKWLHRKEKTELANPQAS